MIFAGNFSHTFDRREHVNLWNEASVDSVKS